MVISYIEIKEVKKHIRRCARCGKLIWTKVKSTKPVCEECNKNPCGVMTHTEEVR